LQWDLQIHLLKFQIKLPLRKHIDKNINPFNIILKS
jgi:hypothetical protein